MTDERAKARLDELQAEGRIGADRVFVGSSDRDATLELKDQLGRTRLHVYVTPEGEAKIEFLNNKGDVVKTISVVEE